MTAHKKLLYDICVNARFHEEGIYLWVIRHDDSLVMTDGAITRAFYNHTHLSYQQIVLVHYEATHSLSVNASINHLI